MDHISTFDPPGVTISWRSPSSAPQYSPIRPSSSPLSTAIIGGITPIQRRRQHQSALTSMSPPHAIRRKEDLPLDMVAYLTGAARAAAKSATTSGNRLVVEQADVQRIALSLPETCEAQDRVAFWSGCSPRQPDQLKPLMAPERLASLTALPRGSLRASSPLRAHRPEAGVVAKV